MSTGAGPLCQDNPDIFDVAERSVGEHIAQNRDLLSPNVTGADEIRAVLAWCGTCFIKTTCQKEMMAARYTGIAGGAFLSEGVQLPTRQ